MKLQLSALGLICLAMGSCIKHVIIPAPKPKVDLKSNFSADTNATTSITYADGADGYTTNLDNYREIKGSPQLSTIIYYNTLKSSSYVGQVKFSIGSAEWDAASGNFPPLDVFTSFFSTTTSYAYDAGGVAGVEIIWKDANGVLWTSRDADSTNMVQSFAFTNVSQQSDDTGDYLKFTASFDCWVFNNTYTDSIHFQNGSYTSYFKNN